MAKLDENRMELYKVQRHRKDNKKKFHRTERRGHADHQLRCHSHTIEHVILVSHRVNASKMTSKRTFQNKLHKTSRTTIDDNAERLARIASALES